MSENDPRVLRDLAKRYADLCATDAQDERRDLWRKHNGLIKTRPPILCSWYWGSNVAGFLLAEDCVCEDPFYRGYELWLRNMIFHETLGDDTIMEPWITVRAAHKIPPECQNGNIWGIRYERTRNLASQAWIIKPSIDSRGQASRLVATPHAIDEEETSSRVARLLDSVGDCLAVNVDRSPFYGCYGGSDIAEGLANLVGLEQMMVYMYDKPELLHDIATFMRDAILAQYDLAEVAGYWSLTNNFNMGMPYCQELPDPRPNDLGASRKQLWYFTCAQPFTLISPRMFYEFMLRYQMPIMARFGLISYGCCEQLTDKIGELKKIPNLRRIGVAPVADVRKCAEQIGRDYVLSWKPNPAMVCVGFDADYVRSAIRQGLQDSRGCNVDVMLKDISTVQGHPERLKEWTQIAREEAERNGGSDSCASVSGG